MKHHPLLFPSIEESQIQVNISWPFGVQFHVAQVSGDHFTLGSGHYTPQLYREYNKSALASPLTNQHNLMSPGFCSRCAGVFFQRIWVDLRPYPH